MSSVHTVFFSSCEIVVNPVLSRGGNTRLLKSLSRGAGPYTYAEAFSYAVVGAVAAEYHQGRETDRVVD
jgi:hypothetical protein